MSGNTVSSTCRLVCWIIGIIAGLIVFFLLKEPLAVILAVILGIVAAVIVAVVLQSLFCKAEAAAAPAPAPAAKPEPVAAPEPAPAAAPAPAAEPAPTAEASDDVAEAQPETLSAAREGGADDLKKLKGVGPKLENLLNELGFYHFDQIAAWTEAEIAWVDSRLSFKGRIQRDGWVEQAKELAKGGN